jgi:hypothetical protein
MCGLAPSLGPCPTSWLAASAFRKAEPAATAKLAKRQERAGIAREVLGEQMKKGLEQQKLQRSQNRALGR